MRAITGAIAAIALLLPCAYATAQDGPQAAAERCKDIEQQGPNKMQQGAAPKEAPQAPDKMSDAGAGSLNSVATGAGGATRDAPRAGDAGSNDRKGMAIGPGTQDCIIYVNPSDKPQ